jgi:LysM repeat protein
MVNQRLSKAIVVLLIGSALLIGACTRSASTPPPATEAAENTPSGLTAQQATMEAVRSELLTQTAQADTGEEEEEPTATNTPEPTEDSAVQPTASSATEVPPTPVDVGVPSTYTLEEGEHPFCIARRFDIEPNQLLSANGLDSESLMSTGDTLTIPQGTGGFPPPRELQAHPTTYTVGAGDTLYSIACEFGDVDPIAIAQANGLTEPYDVSIGMVLDIP